MLLRVRAALARLELNFGDEQLLRRSIRRLLDAAPEYVVNDDPLSARYLPVVATKS